MDDKTLLKITFAVTFILGASCGFWFRGLRPAKPVETVVQTDTLYLRDTLTVEKPVPRIVRVIDTMLVPVVDTVHTRDSVFISLPREKKVYEDSTYRAVVSGFKPSLDSISIYRTTEIVTITETVKVPEKKHWGIGVHAGVGVQYGTIGKRMDVGPYVGVGISYNLLTF